MNRDEILARQDELAELCERAEPVRSADTVLTWDGAVAVLRRLVKANVGYTKHANECDTCPCLECERWFDEERAAIAAGQAWLRQFDGYGERIGHSQECVRAAPGTPCICDGAGAPGKLGP